MNESLVTVATFASPVEAHLALNCLEVAGLRAFLADEETVGTAWHLTNALGGIKLQVEAQDADQALAVLSKGAVDTSRLSDRAEAALATSTSAERPPELDAAEADEQEPSLTDREQNAERALRGAVLGLLLLPLHLYVFWLLLKVFVSEERLGLDQRRRAVVAAMINLPLMVGFCLLLRIMLSA